MRVRGWVLAAAMVAGAATGHAKAAAVDCWLLDGDRLEQAADHGLCDDAFSRNSRPGEAPALGATASLPEPPAPTVLMVKPPKKPTVKTVRARSAPGGPHASRTTPIRSPGGTSASGGDFASRFQRDLGALFDLLGGESGAGNRRRTGGAASLPSHSGR